MAAAAVDATSAASAAPTSVPLGIDDFWATAVEVAGIDVPSERPDLSLLRRLGPFAALDEDLLQHLGPLYRAVAAEANAALEDAEWVAEDAGLDDSHASEAGTDASESEVGDSA